MNPSYNLQQNDLKKNFLSSPNLSARPFPSSISISEVGARWIDKIVRFSMCHRGREAPFPLRKKMKKGSKNLKDGGSHSLHKDISHSSIPPFQRFSLLFFPHFS